MRGLGKLLALLLSLALLLPLASCAKEEKKSTEEEETATAEENETVELTEKDKAFLEEYLKDYENGALKEQMLFQYEDLSAYVNLPVYRGLSFPADPMIETQVSDEEVEAYLTQIYLAAVVPDDQYTEHKEGTVQKYDMATLSYRGVIDGEEIENATAEDQSLLIGSGTFIPGFEEGLLGTQIGTEQVLHLSFSPYYHSEDVAGKDITFYVTVSKIDRPKIPAFDPAVINEYYETDFKTVDEAREWFKEALSAQKKNNAHSSLAAYLQKNLLTQCTFPSFPEKEIKHYEKMFLDYYELQKGEVSWEDYCDTLGITYDTLLADAKDYAKEEVKILLMVFAIAQKENLTCTSEQLGAIIEGVYTTQNTDGYYGSLESMVTDYTDLYGASYFEQMVISAQVSELLVENAVKADV